MKTIFITLLYLLVINVPSFCEDIDDYKVTVIEEGRHGPITFLVIIDSEGKIKNLSVVESNEVKGGKVGKPRFLRQFIGKSSQDPIALRKDIDAVTGATVSSRAAARAARKALEIWKK